MLKSQITRLENCVMQLAFLIDEWCILRGPTRKLKDFGPQPAQHKPITEKELSQKDLWVRLMEWNPVQFMQDHRFLRSWHQQERCHCERKGPESDRKQADKTPLLPTWDTFYEKERMILRAEQRLEIRVQMATEYYSQALKYNQENYKIAESPGFQGSFN